ncbi:MAG: UbiA family prenyltransferase [Kiritimatiellia bacterium]
MKRSSKFTSWLRLFRLPNLPTAIGDALAGAALVSHFLWQGGDGFAGWRPVFAAGFAELFLYMAGLVDNDLVGLEEDLTQAPKRPLPAGEIGISVARVARSVCFAAAVVAGYAGGMPQGWWAVFAAVALCVLCYNRFKKCFPAFGLVSMGLCRGTAVLLGAGAVAPAAEWVRIWQVWALAFGWTAYITAVTWLAQREHEAKEPLGFSRYVAGAVSILLPAIACIGVTAWVLPLFCLLFAFVRWCLSVAPLGRLHSPDIRRKAVGDVIETLLYLQDGFLLLFLACGVSGGVLMMVVAALVFTRHFMTWGVHYLFPAVGGS